MNQNFAKLEALLEKTMAINTSLILLEWDNETLAPCEAGAYTSKVIGTLSGEYYRIMTSDEMKEAVKICQEDSSLDEIQKGIAKAAAEELDQLAGIPADEYRAFAELASKATRIWTDAKKNGDYEAFAPTLKEVVEYQKKFASYRAKDGKKLYDVMLDTYEKGFNMELLDEFFAELKEEIVPLLKEITERGGQIEDGFLTGDYPEEKQKDLAVYLAEYVGFDFDKGVLAVSAHPFTTNLHNHDVRITTHYSDHVDSSLFSVIHEAGHAIYELGIADELTQTLLGQGASMGMHESQSRFFENIIGRNPAFWKPVYGKLKDLFPKQLKGVDLEQFTRAINKVTPGLIRTEADELTYSLHVLIRYEIEKLLIEEDLDVEKLPEIWNQKYQEYLGVHADNPSEGVLQDIHWSQGSFGYFPSYALGSAFGAQLYYHMKKEMDFEGLLEEGKTDVIRDYLRENIHRFGKLKTSRQILKDVTGEDFTPKYYIKYLKEKYSKLYNL